MSETTAMTQTSSFSSRQSLNPWTFSNHIAFRRILPHVKPLGYTVQILSYLFFFGYIINESITNRGWCEVGHKEGGWNPNEIYTVVHTVFWISSGFLWEYLLPITGGRLYFCWGGFRTVVSLALHLFISITNLAVTTEQYNVTLGCDSLSTFEYAMLSVTLIVFGVYLFCLRMNHGPMIEFRNLLDYSNSNNKRERCNSSSELYNSDSDDITNIMYCFKKTSRVITPEQVQQSLDIALKITGIIDDVEDDYDDDDDDDNGEIIEEEDDDNNIIEEAEKEKQSNDVETGTTKNNNNISIDINNSKRRVKKRKFISIDQSIRIGEDGLDDWWCIIHQISTHVSIIPCFRNQQNQLNATQFRQLIKELSHQLSCHATDECKDGQKVPVTITSFMLVWIILNKWLRCPREFVTCLIVMSMAAAVAPVQAIFLGIFTNAAGNTGDSNDHDTARTALIMWCFLAGINPFLMLLLSYCQSKLNTRTMLLCRQSALDVVAVSGSNNDSSSSLPLSPAEIVDTFTSQIGRVEMTLIYSTYTMLFSTMKIVIATISACQVNILVAATFFCLLPVMYSIDDLTKIATGASQRASKLEGKLASNFTSLVDCLPVLRTCMAGQWAGDRIRPILLELKEARQVSTFSSGTISVYYLLWGSVYTLFVIIPFGRKILLSTDDNNSMLIGEFVTLVSLAASMTEPLNRLGGFMREASNAAGCIRKVDELIAAGRKRNKNNKNDGGDDDNDGADDNNNNNNNSLSSSSLSPLSTSIEIKGVVFRYGGSPVAVLKGIDLSFEKGTYNVLCGLSGSGKTTLINVLMRNLQPNNGSIAWDGTEIFKSSLKSFREQVSVMFQRTMILEGTIRENIVFGLVDNHDGKIENAAKMAEIADIIQMLPDGYETVLGGRSTINMSGGQLQRICLARVLYRKPSLLLLDEATSALDPETQASIVKTMVRLRDSENLTIVSISHSTSTSREADQIVVLDQGTIAENGTYDELVKIDDGIFRGMVQASSAMDENEEKDCCKTNDKKKDIERSNSTAPLLNSKRLMHRLKSERKQNQSVMNVECD